MDRAALRKRAREAARPVRAVTPRLEPIEWTESDEFIKGVVAVSNRNRVRDK